MTVQNPGMTLRAYFAGQALANTDIGRAYHGTPDLLAQHCVKCADALIAELQKKR